jgi:hypothetical protein
MDQAYPVNQGNLDNKANQAYLLQDLPENNIEDLKTSTGEVQLLAMISNLEYFCYAIKVKGRDYLMFIDNRVSLDFVKTNQNIVVMEDSLPQAIKLIYLDNGFIQKTINNITVSFVRYSGKINSKNIIKYNDSYFTNVYNSVLKDYENHINELVKDIKYFEMNEINKRKAAQAQTTSTTLTTRRVQPSNNYDNVSNRHNSERCRNRFYTFLGVVIVIIVIVLICTGDIDISDIEWGDDDDDDYYYDDDDDW